MVRTFSTKNEVRFGGYDFSFSFSSVKSTSPRPSDTHFQDLVDMWRVVYRQ